MSQSGAWRRGCAFALLLLTATAATGEIFRWTDTEGKTHFGDRDPGQGGQRIDAPPEPEAVRLEIRVDDAGMVLTGRDRERLDGAIRRVFSVYTGLFHLAMRQPVLIDIALFDSPQELRQWVAEIEPEMAGKLPASTFGLYLTRQKRIGAWRHDPDTEAVLATLIHEASHVMLAQLSPNAPAWLQEGLAQYFEGIALESEEILIRPAPSPAAAIEAMVRHRRLVTLRDYFSLDERRWRHLAHVQQNPVPYAVAWSVCHFLMGRPVGRQIIGELLQDMEKAHRLPTPDAIEKRYPGGYAVMEYDWFTWAQKPKQPQTLSP